jgi:hypothetical protein
MTYNVIYFTAARWNRPNAEALMALAALEQSRLWDAYWTLLRQQAA